MASPSTNRPRVGAALAVLVVLLIGIFAGIVAKAELGNGKYTPRLGLDLAGGTTVTLTAVTPGGNAPPPDQMQQAVNIIRQRVNGLGISEATVTAQGDSIIVQVPGQGQSEVVQQVGQTAKLYFRQVLYAGPGQVSQPKSTPTSQPSAKPGKKGAKAQKPEPTPSGRVLDRALAPSSKPTAAQQPADAKKQPTKLPTSLPSNLQSQLAQQGGGGDTSGIKPEVMQKFRQLDCTKAKNRSGGRLEKENEQIVACSKSGDEKYVLSPVKVHGTHVTKAEARTSPQQFGQWLVNLTFDSKGTDAFGEVTTKAYNEPQGSDRRRIAIELDHRVISAPAIDEGPITGGTAQITGKFTQKEAQDLANVLKYGALPLTFKQSSIRSVSATLGHTQLEGGLLAGALGLALVVVYSFLYYRGLGVVSVLSLGCAAALTYGSVVLLSELVGYRLSLAGIAGLIVAIGITADSFIVYFERLRDEVREGRTLRTAVERGWGRARRTILTADFVSFLAALILYLVSVDQVKGFAFTLGLTTLIDVVVVFVFTKPMLSLLVRTRFYGGGHPLSGLEPSRMGAKDAARAIRRTAVRGV
ncbi:MAG: protein translocase subunit SecD [Streptosporangiales bacterium]